MSASWSSISTTIGTSTRYCQNSTASSLATEICHSGFHVLKPESNNELPVFFGAGRRCGTESGASSSLCSRNKSKLSLAPPLTMTSLRPSPFRSPIPVIGGPGPTSSSRRGTGTGRGLPLAFCGGPSRAQEGLQLGDASAGGGQLSAELGIFLLQLRNEYIPGIGLAPAWLVPQARLTVGRPQLSGGGVNSYTSGNCQPSMRRYRWLDAGVSIGCFTLSG